MKMIQLFRNFNVIWNFTQSLQELSSSPILDSEIVLFKNRNFLSDILVIQIRNISRRMFNWYK